MLRCRSPTLGLEAIGFHFPSNRCLIRSSVPMPFKRPNSSLNSPVPGISLRKGRNSRTESQWSTRLLCTLANSPSSMASTLDLQGVNLLPATNDNHGGVIVDMKDPIDSGTYVSSLRASLNVWSQQGKKGIWIKLPIELSNLVQPTVEEGFRYHHAEPSYLMLVYWIPATRNTLPVNATHRVGVGAFVMNQKKEVQVPFHPCLTFQNCNNLENIAKEIAIAHQSTYLSATNYVLAVQQKSGKFRGSGVWKFPTGVVDPGEYISDGAVREVKEETGIDTEFVEVLAFRQSHKSFFDKSDLFFICMLRPLSFDITKQDSEIEAAEAFRTVLYQSSGQNNWLLDRKFQPTCMYFFKFDTTKYTWILIQWIPIQKFSAQPFVEKHELLKYILNLGVSKFEKGYDGFSSVSIKSAFTDKQSYLYLNTRDLN